MAMTKEDRAAYQREYRLKNPCKRARNKDERRRTQKKYYEKTKQANRDKRLAMTKAWLIRNPTYHAGYRKNNKGIINAKTAKRRAKKLLATPKWLTKLQLEHIKLFYKAAGKLTLELGIKFEVDHIEPLQGELSCGLHVPWNLQVITMSDNRRKGRRISGGARSANND